MESHVESESTPIVWKTTMLPITPIRHIWEERRESNSYLRGHDPPCIPIHYKPHIPSAVHPLHL